jgi:hypothetical protein
MNTKFAGDGGNVVDESEVLEREELRSGRWVDVKIWEGKVPSLLPAFNFDLNLRSPKQVCLLRGCSSFFLGRHVHIWTTTVVLRAIPAVMEVRLLYSNVDLMKKRPTIGGNSRHNVCAYACRFHNPCEIWYGFQAVSISPDDDGDQTYLRRGGPPPGPAIWMRLRGREDRKLRGLERVKAVEEVSDLGGIKRGWGGEGLMC